MPEIIQFSNNLCYPSEPLIPLRQYGLGRLNPIVGTIKISDGYQKGSSPRITNPPEAEALVKKLAQCCADPSYNGKSMGVISLLGEDQARHIERLLLETIGPETMESRKIVCGDAYAFQGDERDVMFLSLVSAPTEGHRIGTLSSPRDERRFNVAVSRARDQLWLVHTASLNDLSPRCLRYRLLEYCQNPRVEPLTLEGVDLVRLKLGAANPDRVDDPPEPFDSWFEVDVFLQLIAKGYRVIPQLNVAGYYIDLVVEGMTGRIAVECDGDHWHGAERYSEDMSRQRQLERCGWTFWRVTGSQYYRGPGVAMQSLWSLLDAMGIRPHSDNSVVLSNQESDPKEERPKEGKLAVAKNLHEPESAVRENFSRQETGTHLDNSVRPIDTLTSENVSKTIIGCVPFDSKIKREVLLEMATQTLGYPRLTRELRHRLNTAISALVQKGDLRVDQHWDHVWRSSQMAFPGATIID